MATRYTVNAGDLRTSVVLGSPSLDEKPGGFKRKSYTPVKTVWARWVNAHGSEALVAESVQLSQPATVTIREYPDIDTTWGIQKDGQWYDIISLDRVQDRHRYIELKVSRMVGT